MSSPDSHQAEPATASPNNNNSFADNIFNNNKNNSSSISVVDGSLTSAQTGDGTGVKVILTIPPDNSYPKSLYPYTPFRLLPMSRFADVGKFYVWKDLKEKVTHILCLPLLVPHILLLFVQCHAAGDAAQ
jgi:hypothetical protein